jgi:hypothetical protein
MLASPLMRTSLMLFNSNQETTSVQRTIYKAESQPTFDSPKNDGLVQNRFEELRWYENQTHG